MDALSAIIQQIIRLREQNGLTQEQVAKALGLSRQSYNQVEQGRRDLSLQELELLSGLFGVSMREFFTQSADIEKFQQMYFYILQRLGSTTKTKLAKLLYLADFRNFYETLESMSGVNYVCRSYGPVADVFFDLTNELFDQGKIDIASKGDALIISSTVREQPQGILSEDEKRRIDEIVDLWRDKRTSEIVAYTHDQKPWRACRNGEYIPYELIIQEDPAHVYTPLTR
jgi:putative transcriptional regulator